MASHSRVFQKVKIKHCLGLLQQFVFQQLSYELSFAERLCECISGGGILQNIYVSAVYFPKCEMVKITALGQAHYYTSEI